MFYKFSDKKSAEELHEPMIRKFDKIQAYSSFKNNV